MQHPLARLGLPEKAALRAGVLAVSTLLGKALEPLDVPAPVKAIGALLHFNKLTSDSRTALGLPQVGPFEDFQVVAEAFLAMGDVTEDDIRYARDVLVAGVMNRGASEDALDHAVSLDDLDPNTPDPRAQDAMDGVVFGREEAEAYPYPHQVPVFDQAFPRSF